MLSGVEHLINRTWRKWGGQEKFQKEGEFEGEWVRHQVVHILVEVIGLQILFYWQHMYSKYVLS